MKSFSLSLFSALVCLHVVSAADLPSASLHFEARVVEVSHIPDPQKNTYPNCLFAVKVEPRVPAGESPVSVLLVLEVFRDRVLTEHAGLSVSDVIWVDAVPFVDMPKNYQSLQLVDDTTDLDIPVVAGLSVSRLADLSGDTDWEWRGLETENIGRARPVGGVSPVASAARRATIERDLQVIADMLAPFGDWESWYDAVAPIREQLLTRLAESPTGYLRRDPYVFQFGGGVEYELSDEDAGYQKVLQSFETMRDEFAAVGTDLIVLPIPMRDQVYAAKFVDEMPDDGVLQPYWLKFHHDLLARDIEVIDLLPAFRQALDEGDFLFHYNTTDGHPATAGAMIAAEAVYGRMMRYWFATPRRSYGTYAIEYGPKKLKVLFSHATSYPGCLVKEADGEMIRNEDVSEVLLIGDSMLSAPAQARHGQLTHHLIRHLGFPVSIFKRAGSPHQMTRSLYRDVGMDYLSGRKVCVFAFSFMRVPHEEREWANVLFVSGREGQ